MGQRIGHNGAPALRKCIVHELFVEVLIIHEMSYCDCYRCYKAADNSQRGNPANALLRRMACRGSISLTCWTLLVVAKNIRRSIGVESFELCLMYRQSRFVVLAGCRMRCRGHLEMVLNIRSLLTLTSLYSVGRPATVNLSRLKSAQAIRREFVVYHTHRAPELQKAVLDVRLSRGHASSSFSTCYKIQWWILCVEAKS